MKYEEKINTVRVIVSSFVLLAIPLFLIYKQPNLSTMIVITLVFCALLFMAGLNYKLVVGVLIVCIPVQNKVSVFDRSRIRIVKSFSP